MSVGSDLRKEEIWKVSAAVVRFLNIQLCASDAEAKRERSWAEAGLLGTATHVAEPDTWLIVQSCSKTC